MLSNTCKTAIKAVIYLATKYKSEQKISLKEIAQYIEASEHTVGKMVQTLVKQDVIKSSKGPSGGFYLTKEQRKQPLITIIEAIDGKQFFKECGLGLNQCSSSHPCPIHYEYKESRDIFEKLVKKRRILDLCEPVSEGQTYLAG